MIVSLFDLSQSREIERFLSCAVESNYSFTFAMSLIDVYFLVLFFFALILSFALVLSLVQFLLTGSFLNHVMIASFNFNLHFNINFLKYSELSLFLAALV